MKRTGKNNQSNKKNRRKVLADPAAKVDVGTLLQDPAVNKPLAMITNQPGLFAQVANSAAAVADTSAASNNDDSVSEQRRGSRRRHFQEGPQDN
ncbi:hypothetical protein SEMRO_1499_G277710.1 [Seminavis robusta]|uniref:Uncharacterized protein n=1 Tax=Seminavis robusta TaxID=568900 RepID=A0A9N8ELS6_9STRA|nr:hypothetical protein SEMRO_1499_G277710.1 [Seminavis robusta]|eukprot:Sro1499_g277710.1 n/a (94) ;mRNA; f:1269-1689